MLDGNPCAIINNEIVKPGKGQAFNRVKFKDLISGKILVKTFKSGESLQGADVMELTMQYLYSSKQIWYFMQPDSFEQYDLNEEAVADAKLYLVEQENYLVTLWDDKPITVTPPNHIVLEVVETDPGVKGDSATTSGKPAVMNTGLVVQVPLFINIGECIKINTSTDEYISRA